MQITDPKNQGKGQQSNIILGRIEQKLGSKLTPLTPIPPDPLIPPWQLPLWTEFPE
jgi:hypothetical protein